MFEKVKAFLNSNKVIFKEVYHEPTKTSEESAKARGEDLSTGGKALVIKVDKTFKLFVISASKRLDSKAIKKFFNAKKIRFASQEELFELTHLQPGSVPPFGKPLLDFDLYVDESIIINEKIAFNAGSLTDSIIMNTKDYLEITLPKVFKFSE